MSQTLTNRPTLATIGDLPASKLIEMSGSELALLLDEADDLLARGKTARSFLEAVIADKYKDRIDAAYAAKDEPFGDAAVADDGVEFKFKRPKNVDWDARQLENISTMLSEQWGSNPNEYIDVKRSVSETKFKAWPTEIKSLFVPARTVKAGKTAISVKFKE